MSNNVWNTNNLINDINKENNKRDNNCYNKSTNSNKRKSSEREELEWKVKLQNEIIKTSCKS